MAQRMPEFLAALLLMLTLLMFVPDVAQTAESTGKVTGTIKQFGITYDEKASTSRLRLQAPDIFPYEKGHPDLFFFIVLNEHDNMIFTLKEDQAIEYELVKVSSNTIQIVASAGQKVTITYTNKNGAYVVTSVSIR